VFWPSQIVLAIFSKIVFRPHQLIQTATIAKVVFKSQNRSTKNCEKSLKMENAVNQDFSSVHGVS
jgi:hypothetical protein